MDSANHLNYLLQSQLATDASAIRYLPYCLSSLTEKCFRSSSHIIKWTTRIQSLLHSKEAGARWAGLCLAYKTALLSQKLMIESAQSWLTIVLPILSRNEPLPTLKAAIRLLRVIFTTAVEISEFQRQVSMPNVVKFTHAIISVADSHIDLEVKILCFRTLTQIVVLYPTTHRASINALSAFALRNLDGSIHGTTNSELLEAASRLYAVIPLTGGKVGAINLWRKSLDETLRFGWDAFYALRTTFPVAQNIARPSIVGEPQEAIPLSQDKLRCCVVILRNLLSATIQRPVQVPIGGLVKFINSLIGCSNDGQIDGFVDPFIRSMEISVVPDIWNQGYQLLVSLAEQFPYCLDPHANRLFTILAYRLEQQLDVSGRLYLLQALNALLKYCRPMDSNILPTRLAKCALSSITKIILASHGAGDQNEPSSSEKKHGKKRARNFEGDEVFKITRQVVYPSVAEIDALLVSIDVVELLFKYPMLSSAMHSIIARVITAVLIALPRMSPSALSDDPNLLKLVTTKIQRFSFIVGSGTTSVMSKTLPFLVESALTSSEPELQRNIGILLHPRVPPLVRSMPHVESLSLFKAEESQEEKNTLSCLGVADPHPHLHRTDGTPEDVITEDAGFAQVPTAEVFEHVAHGLGDANNAHGDLPPTFHKEQEEYRSILPEKYPTMKPPNETNLASTTASSTAVDVENLEVSQKSRAIFFSTDQDQEDEDEEMPTIDMRSDSEDEEE